MSNEIALPPGFGPLPTVFQGQSSSVNDELGAGVASSYSIMGYRGKVWSVKYQGTEHPLMRPDGDGPRNSIEVVLLKASPAVSKIFYKNGYVEGSNAAPDCWSANGVTPDASVQNKVHPTCADCPMNAWGSRVTEAGSQAKKCTDSRRVAIVPVPDIENEMFGGPMLLRIPAASLKSLKQYGMEMESYQYPYYSVVTRVAFDPNEAYPKFVFKAVRPLSEEEGKKVAALRDGPQVKAVLSETQETAAPVQPAVASAPPASPFEEPPVEETKPASPFEQPQAAPSQPAAQPAAPASPFDSQPEAPQAEEPKPAAQPAPAQSAPSSFDDMLDSII